MSEYGRIHTSASLRLNFTQVIVSDGPLDHGRLEVDPIGWTGIGVT
jgi:hypothetical protein